MTRRCTGCGLHDTDAAHGLCPDCVHKAAVTSRQAQGLPPTITDPEVWAQLGALTRPAHAPAEKAS